MLAFVRTRLVVGLIGAAIVLTALWAGEYWFLGVILFSSVVGSYEFFTLLARTGHTPVASLGIPFTVLLVIAFFRPEILPLAAVLPLGFIVTLTFALFSPHQPLSIWLTTTLPAVYIGVMLGECLALRMLPHGLWWMVFALAVVWGNDTLAYFTGVTVGRHRLWPRLSPKKTWEGTIGGWVGAAIIGGVLAAYAPLPLGALAGVVLGAIGGVLALFGDLSISMVKRQVGVKDSGSLFPGHGGMLDRLDSVLFVIPTIYLAALYWNQ